MIALTVGKLFAPGVTRWAEGPEYNYLPGGHFLRLSFAEPSPQEISGVAKGACDFALHVDGRLIVLFYRFGEDGDAIPWSDAPYDWHLVPEGDLPSADLAAASRAALTVALVDATTGVLEALRIVTLSHDFTIALHGAIRAQAALPRDDAAFNRALDAYYASGDSELLARRTKIRTKGGA